MENIIIVSKEITKKELKKIAEKGFGDFVKAVVDIEFGIMAIGGELHADEEAVLLENNSKQRNLWGINFYPGEPEDKWIEYDSMINIRPSQGNNSRNVESEEIRENIIRVVKNLVK